MGILAAALLLTLQDADTRYREGLYLEVDKGDLDRALEVYRAVEADAAAAEPVRAKASFRKAWCLEKKGLKAEAEKAYREVTTRFPSQAESVQRARERLDRVASGEGPAAVPTIENRISDLILNLASGDEARYVPALRSLSLIGEPAVPALRQALQHKDPTLSAMAAYALLRMDRDEGTYAPLMVWVRKGGLLNPKEFAKLLERRPEFMKEFIEEFRKTDQEAALRGMFSVIDHLKDYDALKARLRELVVSGPLDSVSQSSLRISNEAELFDLLEALRTAPDGPARAMAIMDRGAVLVRDVPKLGKLLVALFPKGIGKLRFLHNFAPLDEILRECAGPWLRMGDEDARSRVHQAIDNDLGDWLPRAPLILHLLDGELPAADRTEFILDLVQLTVHQLTEVKGSAEKQLWTAFDREKADVRSQVSEMLLQLVPDTHARWEELIRFEIAQPLSSQASVYHLFRPEQRRWPHQVSAFPGLYPSWSPEGRARARRVVCRRLLEGDVEGRRAAMKIVNIAPFTNRDPDRSAALTEMARDATLETPLRVEAISAVYGNLQESPQLKETVDALLKEPEPALRQAAVNKAAQSRGDATDALLAPLVADANVAVATEAVAYFAGGPRDGFLHPLIKALESRDAGIRKLAITGLGASEQIGVVPDLLKYLDDSNADVRAAVRAALQRIRNRYEERAQWLEWYEKVKPTRRQ